MTNPTAGTQSVPQPQNPLDAITVCFLLKVKINRNHLERLKKLGIPVIERTEKTEAEIRERQTEEAKQQGLDPFRYDRFNSQFALPDSGISVTSQEGDKGKQMVCPMEMFQNFRQMKGVVMNNIHIIIKTQDIQKGMGTLVISFVGTTAFPNEVDMKLNRDLLDVLKSRLSRTYEHCHVFLNPNGVATFNLSHVMEQEADYSLRSFQEADGAIGIAFVKK